jgi:hypothetical protein
MQREPTVCVRVKESTHRVLKAVSALAGKSMQQFIEDALMPREQGAEAGPAGLTHPAGAPAPAPEPEHM